MVYVATVQLITTTVLAVMTYLLLRKQVNIAHDQAHIANRQSETAKSTLAIARTQAETAKIQATTAAQQGETSRQNLRLALFSRRLTAYHAIRELVGRVTTNFKVSDDALKNFREQIKEAEFLFPRTLFEHMEKFFYCAVSLRANSRRLEHAINLRDVQNVDAHNEKETELVTWLIDADDNLADRFRPYLAFDDFDAVEHVEPEQVKSLDEIAAEATTIIVPDKPAPKTIA